MRSGILFTTSIPAVLISLAPLSLAQERKERPFELRRRETQDRVGGVPEEVLKLQSLEKVRLPSLDEAIEEALRAAREAARPLIDRKFHDGRRFEVPGDFETIQAALDVAKPRDAVIVAPGTWFELLTVPDGVKLVSASSDGGDELVAVEGARLKLPRRALRTILDGSRSEPSRQGMFDFAPGAGRTTIVDGFTIRNLPEQNHHLPGHAHGLNMRGASPVIMNCYIRKNGSTGIGNHALYRDQGSPLEKRDFRGANVEHPASALIFGNIIRNNLGLGIGCNHLSSPWILGNEVCGNDDSKLGELPSPGIGAQHGASPTIIGNLVHGNPGGGILAKLGESQGAHAIDRRTRPTVMKNVVWANGSLRPGISCSGGGSMREPVRLTGNFVKDSGAVGIGLADGATGVIEANLVCSSRQAGIAVVQSTALLLDRNQVTGAGAPGFVIVSGSLVLEMRGNAANSNRGPRFLLRESRIGK
ncbi:MAG: right-handed parallel beta-helix repeat-containing protein [Planctomycetota bacterium]